MQQADYASRTRPTAMAFLVFLLSLSAHAQAPSSLDSREGDAPRLLDPTRDMLFLTYERVEVRNEGEPVRPVRRLVFRLHNNSTCGIALLTSALDDVAQPTPANASMLERANPKLYEVIPDGHVVQGLRCYAERVSKPGVQKPLAGGDAFFGFSVTRREGG